MLSAFIMLAAMGGGAGPQDAQSQPRPIDPANWVLNDDYPPAALRAAQQGMVRFELKVSDAGIATDCNITRSSGSPALDTTTCALMRERARFEPAHDADGRAVASVYKGLVRWELPEPNSNFQPLISWRVIVVLDVAANGKVAACRPSLLRSDPGYPSDDAHFCSNYSERDFSGIAMGKPVQIVFHDEQEVSGQELQRDQGRSGFETLYRKIVRFKVDGYGHAADCETVEQVGDGQGPEPCASSTPWSKPDQAPVTVYASEAVLVKRLPVAP